MCACECASARSKRAHEGFDNKEEREREYKKTSVTSKQQKEEKKTEGQLKKKTQNIKETSEIGHKKFVFVFVCVCASETPYQ